MDAEPKSASPLTRFDKQDITNRYEALKLTQAFQQCPAAGMYDRARKYYTASSAPTSSPASPAAAFTTEMFSSPKIQAPYWRLSRAGDVRRMEWTTQYTRQSRTYEHWVFLPNIDEQLLGSLAGSSGVDLLTTTAAQLPLLPHLQTVMAHVYREYNEGLRRFGTAHMRILLLSELNESLAAVASQDWVFKQPDALRGRFDMHPVGYNKRSETNNPVRNYIRLQYVKHPLLDVDACLDLPEPQIRIHLDIPGVAWSDRVREGVKKALAAIQAAPEEQFPRLVGRYFAIYRVNDMLSVTPRHGRLKMKTSLAGLWGLISNRSGPYDMSDVDLDVGDRAEELKELGNAILRDTGDPCFAGDAVLVRFLHGYTPPAKKLEPGCRTGCDGVHPCMRHGCEAVQACVVMRRIGKQCYCDFCWAEVEPLHFSGYDSPLLDILSKEAMAQVRHYTDTKARPEIEYVELWVPWPRGQDFATIDSHARGWPDENQQVDSFKDHVSLRQLKGRIWHLFLFRLTDARAINDDLPEIPTKLRKIDGVRVRAVKRYDDFYGPDAIDDGFVEKQAMYGTIDRVKSLDQNSATGHTPENSVITRRAMNYLKHSFDASVTEHVPILRVLHLIGADIPELHQATTAAQQRVCDTMDRIQQIVILIAHRNADRPKASEVVGLYHQAADVRATLGLPVPDWYRPSKEWPRQETEAVPSPRVSHGTGFSKGHRDGAKVDFSHLGPCVNFLARLRDVLTAVKTGVIALPEEIDRDSWRRWVKEGQDHHEEMNKIDEEVELRGMSATGDTDEEDDELLAEGFDEAPRAVRAEVERLLAGVAAVDLDLLTKEMPAMLAMAKDLTGTDGLFSSLPQMGFKIEEEDMELRVIPGLTEQSLEDQLAVAWNMVCRMLRMCDRRGFYSDVTLGRFVVFLIVWGIMTGHRDHYLGVPLRDTGSRHPLQVSIGHRIHGWPMFALLVELGALDPDSLAALPLERVNILPEALCFNYARQHYRDDGLVAVDQYLRRVGEPGAMALLMQDKDFITWYRKPSSPERLRRVLDLFCMKARQDYMFNL
ncbi:hypothetical protein FB45DRAFT_907939 [Roridomyces roridus]|uniref:Uncharacterized protein n=1 Tax=Roridomyces roridus TaxID=1738132 RepID=A0AAD7C270_9AGAR|nr:hypothetical protein FB45DRAFT_907939 [Roridomyces roridus]